MIDDEFGEDRTKKKLIVSLVAAGCLVVVLIVAVVLIFQTFGGDDSGENAPGMEEDADGQQTEDGDGNLGTDGSDGSQGSAGGQGTDESDGSQGGQGTDGSDGSQGGQGTDGSDGSQGGAGGQGSSGSAGGSTGGSGNQGSTGNGTEYGMKFQEVSETVTAKDVTNLRNVPSQGEESTVLRQLNNGETATRTGISDSGWSRLVLDGTTYYAVSNYLTTDLSYHTEKPEDDGIKTKFTACQENVTPKIEINLRSIPSVTNPDSVVVATVPNGEIFVRTGINTEVGWSRVEYNGQVLYCVSSYLNVVE